MAALDDRERQGLEMVLSGLRQGLAWMPEGCPSWQSLHILVPPLEHRAAVLRAAEVLGYVPTPSFETALEVDRKHHQAADEIRDEVWRSEDAKRARIFEALGDERLTVREVMQRINAAYTTKACGPRARIVGESYVRAALMRLLQRGELTRELEVYRNKPRYRWSIRREQLDGPIADLERAFNDEPEEV